MWQKALIIILLFYLLLLLQSSFFAHFSLFGANLNLVFIVFFLLAFFLPLKQNFYQIIYLAIVVGFFLDIFSSAYLGPSIIGLLIIGFLLKKVQSLLRNRKDNFPFIYFLPLFVICWLLYHLAITGLRLEVVFSLIYNALVASLLFFAYKKYRYAKLWQKFTGSKIQV